MKRILFVALFYLSISVHAQEIKLIEGSLEVLKGEKTLNVEFTYENLKVDNYGSEEDFIREKRDNFNSKEPGRGDSWASDWKQDRTSLYEPSFCLLFKKYSKLTTGNVNSNYTMIVHTVYLDTGFNALIVWAIPTFFIDLEVTIVETKNPKNVISKIMMIRCPAKKRDAFLSNTGELLQEGYAKAGKELGRFLKSKIEK